MRSAKELKNILCDTKKYFMVVNVLDGEKVLVTTMYLLMMTKFGEELVLW